jgi:hypothetical protein
MVRLVDAVVARVINDVSASSIGNNGVNSGFIGNVDKVFLPLINKGEFFRSECFWRKKIL